jgi:putative ABC transport system permease protein
LDEVRAGGRPRAAAGVKTDVTPFKRYLRLPGSEQREVDDELSYHIEMKVEQLMKRGLSSDEARREAQRQFGDREQIRQEVEQLVHARVQRERRAGWLDAARQDVRFALRQLRSTPGFTFVAVLTIALGIGATTAIFSVVRAVLLRPLPYAGAERIVLIGEVDDPATADARTTTSYPTYEDWKARARSFEAMGLFNSWAPTLTGSGETERLAGSFVTAPIFDVFRIRPVLGRPMVPSDNVANGPAIVWISWSLWQSRMGGAADVIGRTITLSGRAREIVGVLPRDFIAPNAELSGEVWGPNYFDENDGRTARYLNVAARLKPGVPIEQAAAEMKGLQAQMAQENPEAYRGMYPVVFPLRELVIGSKTRGWVLLLMLASAVVLLIACANTSNLLIARGTYRAREFAIRAALGTTRLRMIRQLLTESIVLGVVGALLGIAIATLGVRALMQLAPELIKQQDVSVDATVLAFALLSALGSALAFGLLPAFRAGRSDVQHTLREEGRGSTSARARTLRRSLAVVQLSLALSLVLSAGLLIKSFARVLQVDPGIRPENMLSFSMILPTAKYNTEALPRFYEEVVRRAQATPRVLDAAVASIVPFSGGWDRIVVDTGTARLPGSEMPEGDRYIVSPSYFRTMGIPLRQGRTFEPSDLAGPPVAVVDEVFARKVARNGSAIGVRIGVPGRDTAATIVGVVGHVKHYGLDAESGGQIYVSHLQYPWRYLSLIVRTNRDPLALTPAMRAVVHSIDRDQPISDIKTLEAYMSDRTAARRFVLALLGAFAAIALLLASVGLYGVISYNIAQRRREFGIRLALGATPRSLVRMVMQEGGGVVALGISIGILLAWAGARLLGSLLFDVRPLDPTVLVAAAVFLSGIAGIAVWVPARRAGRADPLETLASN